MHRVIGGMLCSLLALAAISQASAAEPPVAPSAARPLKFVMHRVGNFRSEACGVADFNQDRKPDIAAGPYLYLAPDWKPVKYRELEGKVDEKGKGYYDDFANAPVDVDGDGWVDVVSARWFDKSVVWFRNPGKLGPRWEQKLIERNGNFEAAEAVDLVGKGSVTAIVPATTRTVWYDVSRRPGRSEAVVHVVSEKNFTFGVGAGDVNGDGRPDILRPGAWYEAPADLESGRWVEHPLALGDKNGKIAHTAQISTYDVNGDRLPDIICSNAHQYGIFWYEQVRQAGQVAWKQHTIDDTWSQAHVIVLADINGDGLPELITGKRFMAHNGSDPDEFGPLGVYWYQLKPGVNPTWTRNTVSYNQGVGAGMNIEVVDLNGDGRLDLVTTGKWGGPVWFENRPR